MSAVIAINFVFRLQWILTGAVALALAGSVALASEFTVKVVEKEPPREVDAAIRQAVQAKAVQLLDGDKAVCEFWFNLTVPLKSKPDAGEKALQAVKETTLLGVVALHTTQRDYKDNEIAAGTYTARFGLQPQDGDHLGTADYPYFAVLIPAKADTKLEGFADARSMLKASGKDTSSGHPVVLSLRPVSTEDGGLPKLTEPVPDHKCLRINLPAKVGNKEEKPSITFDLVYNGKGKT
jgi:hypothetical protein